MPCRVDVCDSCHEFYCICGTPYGKNRKTLKRFDWEGALCDTLSMLRDEHPKAFADVEHEVFKMFELHQQTRDMGKPKR